MHAPGFPGDRAEHVRGERHFEMGFAECGAALADQQIDHFARGCFQFVGGAMQDFLAQRGGRIAPGGFCAVCGIDRGAHVLFLRHENFGEWFLIGWIEDVRHRGWRDFDGLAVNVGSGEHGVPSFRRRGSRIECRESSARARVRVYQRSCTIYFVRILLCGLGMSSNAIRIASWSSVAPDAAGDVCHEAQLGPLLVFGQQIAFHGGGEAALRT